MVLKGRWIIIKTLMLDNRSIVTLLPYRASSVTNRTSGVISIIILKQICHGGKVKKRMRKDLTI